MTEIQDNELITKIKDDNQSAFEVVFLRYYSGLCTYAMSILGSRDTSEEIVQDVFVRLWETRKTLEVTTSFKAYIYRIVHNQCINYIESRRVREQYSKKQQENFMRNLVDTVPFTGDYPIANLIVQELEDKIRESIDALPGQCREIFLLIRLQHKSYQEVATKLNISLNTVKTQMQRAVFKMREMLQEYLPVILFLIFF